MRVKRLEIQGFKSFKDKTVVHFDHTITGIVGPNGCGKSNIVDAFFWVMGEQSYKHMRGSSSDDLIFNGSSKYAPLGVAEATLVMEIETVDTANAPSGASAADLPMPTIKQEISVTRRLYRTGEGEYFINGKAARLKDIHELFMDTGVGAKGYSVIEQGQIGKVVNAKPEDRRVLIEEAAGIAKYKARKKESLRKMEATQANLSRLADIIQEIERGLGSLERQAQKAKTYKRYKEELFDKEVTWVRRRSASHRQKVTELTNLKQSLEQEITGLRAALQVAENQIELQRVSQLDDNKSAEALQIEIESLAETLSIQRSSLEVSTRRQGDITAHTDRLEQERAGLADALAAQGEQLAERSTQLKEAETKHRILQDQLTEAQSEWADAKRSLDQARHDLEDFRRKLLSEMSENSQLESTVAHLQSKIESLGAQSTQLQGSLSDQEAKVAQSQSELAATEAKLQDLRTQHATEAQALSELKTREIEVSKLFRAKREEMESSRKETLKARSRLESLEEVANRREGFAAGPRHALQWEAGQPKTSDGRPAIEPLADLLEVSPGFESSVEAWLESRLESLATQKPGRALEIIQELRTKGLGRLSVLELSSGKGGGPEKTDAEAATDVSAQNCAAVTEAREALAQAGVEWVSDLASAVAPKGGAGHLRGLFSRVAVVRGLARAATDGYTKLIESLGDWSVVDADDGLVIEACNWSSSGAGPTRGTSNNGALCRTIRGGGLGKSAAAGILQQKREINERRQALETLESNLSTLTADTEKLEKELDAVRASHQEKQEAVRALEIQVAREERDAHQLKRTHQENLQRLEQAKRQIEGITNQMADSESRLAEAKSQVDRLIQHRFELESQISGLQPQLETRENLAQEADALYQSLRVQEASARERAQSLARELVAQESIAADRTKRNAEIEMTLTRLRDEYAGFAGSDDDLKQKITELNTALADQREKLAAVKDRLEQASASVNTEMERMKDVRSAVDDRARMLTTTTVDLERIASELDFMVKNLEEKYGIGCLDIQQQPTQSDLPEPVVTVEMTAEEELQLGEEVERLRERIRRLGEVNPGAIEEFAEAQKRHEFLVREKADLEQSIDNLNKAIEHINKTSEERFRKAFTAISDRFEKLFPIVFGGGQAQLSLVYPEGSTDILDAGIDILAQPPGKKVSNITLLSGGEKALTAVSLIFAIFLVKPSPFCVLDEVDAPLDDSNIGRFNALLREMSSRSQFILITHNKKTMELNDTLYGVTMEEPGVSKMVSIELA